MNDCSAGTKLLWASCALKSLYITVKKDLQVFVSCWKCSGSSVEVTIAEFDQVKHFWLNIVTRVIVLHKQRERKRLRIEASFNIER